MELRYLTGFVAVAEHLSFSSAGRHLHLSQPALSRMIRKLERELGTTLLDRSTHGVTLTSAGEAFLSEARAVLDQVQVAVDSARAVAPTRCASLRVGHGDGTEGLLPWVLRSFRERLPDVPLSMSANDGCPADALRDRFLDVVVGRTTTTDDLVASEVVDEEPFVVALPQGHRLLEAVPMTISKLSDEPLVLLPRRVWPEGYDHVLACCERAGFSPSLADEATSFSSVVVLAAAGVGAGLVPRSFASSYNAGDIAYRELDGSPVTLPVTVAWRRDDSSEPLTRFLELIRSRKH